MTVKELKTMLENFDDSLEVLLGGNGEDDECYARDIERAVHAKGYQFNEEEYTGESFIVLEEGGFKDPVYYGYRKN